MESIGEGVSNGLSKSAADLIDKIYAGAMSKIGEARDIALLEFKKGFDLYLSQMRERCRLTKTLINRYEPVDVAELYVPLQFRFGQGVLENSGLIGRLNMGRQIIVTGIAGSGKSLTLKKTFLDIIDGGQSIPVFIEFRNFADFDGGLSEYICREISRFTGSFTERGLIHGLRKGFITLLLDGFDEVPRRRMEQMERDLHDLIASAPHAKILISGRPHSRYHSWHSVDEARVESLGKPQVLKLIQNFRFDEEAKTNFAKRIESSLFDSHTKLVSNPLLCCLMLLTVEDFSEVPASMHVYYRKAFEVLYRKHDSLKPQYSREFSVSLQEDDFRRIFEGFCYFSFLDGKFVFEIDEALSYISEALKYENINVSAFGYLDDLIDNVCVLLKDGDSISFIHRSFQEYFAASFLSTRNHAKFMSLMNDLSETFLDAELLNFMIEMNLEVLERGYLIPAIETMVDFVKERKTQEDKFAAVFSGIFVSGKGNCAPVVDLKSSHWLGAGFVAVGKISRTKFQLPALKPDLYERIKSEFVDRSVRGSKGFTIKSTDRYIFENICRAYDLGDVLLKYLLEVQSAAAKKEGRRARLLGKRSNL